MPLFVLGVNHNTAPVHLREQVVFDPSSIPDALEQLGALPGVDEVMVLSTCNRTEIIGSGSAGALACARDWLINSQSMNHELQDSLFEQSEEQCARHVFRVAAGLGLHGHDAVHPLALNGARCDGVNAHPHRTQLHR